MNGWHGDEALPVGAMRLLEASAGTGKTWQIAHLVVRLVTEAAVPIERILVLTFTNAATAELRDRVRKRLVEARTALEGPCPDATVDPLLAKLWQDDRARRAARIAAALSGFDLAPIVTIHGFCQRMLAQLAFESREEPGLELLAEVRPLLDEYVADALSRAYADAALPVELAVAEDMGWTRDGLLAVARAVTGAAAPRIEPAEAEAELSVVACARQWTAQVQAFSSWLDGRDGQAAVRALTDEMARPTAAKAKVERRPARRFDGTRYKLPADWLAVLRGWLDGGATWSARLESWTKLGYLTCAKAQPLWTGQDPFVAFAAHALYVRFDALLAGQAVLWPRARSAFALRVRRHVEDELRRRGLLTYDAMLSRLHDRLASEGSDGPLCSAIRARFDVALVDEFQDTDAAQWRILGTVFRHPERRLIAIGDPKQAIYAFRGADVHVYLRAAAQPPLPERATMTRNWRSDPDLVLALNRLWVAGSRPFLRPEFDYVEVLSAHGAVGRRIGGRSPVAGGQRLPIELRWFDGTSAGDDGVFLGQRELGERLAARLCAREAATLIGQATLGERPVAAGDIAVLVRTNSQADLAKQALAEWGIAAVAAGRGSVFASEAASWLLAWLDAVAAPGLDRAARTVATTPLFGWTLRDLHAALDGEPDLARQWDDWLVRLARWAHDWPRVGFVRVFEAALDECLGLPRLLQSSAGERGATDLRHLAELCHAEERRTRSGPQGLATWLRVRRAEAGEGGDDVEALRLESDACAVRIVTVHKAKGLEYPVVLLPFAWSARKVPDRGQPLPHHGVAGDGEARLDLHPKGTQERDDAAMCAERDDAEEQRRLLYVALTRAAHHCVVWLGPVGGAGLEPNSQALVALLLRSRDAEGAALEGGPPPFQNPLNFRDEAKRQKARAENEAVAVQWHERLDALQAHTGGLCDWSWEPPLTAARPTSPAHEPATPLAARIWPTGRTLHAPWTVASFTSLAAAASSAGDEPLRADDVREAAPGADDASDAAPMHAELPPLLLAAPSAWEGLRGGRDAGTWVHAVLERLDFATGTAKADGAPLADLAGGLGKRHGIADPVQHRLVAELLPAALATPIGGGATGLAASWALRDLPASDRVDELGFDLALTTGTTWRPGDATVDPAAVRAALANRAGDKAFSGHKWLRALLTERAPLPLAAGLVTGYIDLVLRCDGRYWLADYKTNRIAPPHDRHDSRLYHYSAPWLEREMARHDYHLQALLYSLAVHRWLRQRVDGWDYERHFGGHLYLFLRGMHGATTPRDANGLSLGAYHDRWPLSVVAALDAALAGGA